MDIILIIGLSVFSLSLLYFLFILKKRNSNLHATLKSNNKTISQSSPDNLTELSAHYNMTKDLMGIIEINNNGEFFLKSLNQASISFINNLKNDNYFQPNLLGKPFFSLLKEYLYLPKDQVEDQLNQFEKVILSKQRISYESSFLSPNNVLRFYDITLTPVIDKITGKCKQIIFECVNITKRVQAQKELIKNEKRLSSIYNATNDFSGLIHLNDEGEYLLESINQSSITFLSSNKLIDHADDLINQPIKKLLKKTFRLSDNSIQMQMQLLDNVFSLNETVMYENSFNLKDKNLHFELEMTLSPILNSKEKCVQALFSAKDITVRKRIERELIASEAHAKTLFEYSPIIIWDEDFSEVKKAFDALKENGVSDFKTYFDKNPKALETLSSLIKVKDINQKSVDFYAMGNKEDHINNVPFYFVNESWDILKKELIALAEGETTFESEIPIKKLDGSIVYLVINLSIPPIYIDTWESIIVSFLDVSERKKAELLLAQSKEKIKAQLEQNKLIIENTLNGYILADIEGNIVDVNASYINLMGYTKAELLTMNIYQIETQKSPKEIKTHIKELTKKGSARFETIHQKKDGSYLIFDANLNFMQHENTQMIVAFLGDITDQKRTQKELEYRFNFESLLSKISSQFINLNIEETDQAIKNALHQLCEFTNFDRSTIALFSKEADSCSIHYEWHKPDAVSIFNSFQNNPLSNLPWLFGKIKNNESILITSQKNIPDEARGLLMVSQALNLNSIIQVPIAWQAKIIGFLSFSSSEEKPDLSLNMDLLLRLAGEMISNVLQRKNTAEAIKETEKKANDLLIFKILETEDRERKRMSKELHDSLGQNLTTASLNLNHLHKIIAKNSVEDQLKFKNGLKFLNIAIDESRNIAHNLMPQTIIDFGYVDAIESLTEDLSKSSKTNFVFYTNLQDRLYPDQELSLFRITQEAINNILKHAKASKVTIQLMKYNDAILLTIEDNGVGFDLRKVNGNSFGLNSIKNRVSALSGQIDIDTQPSKGTSITVKVEIQRET